MKKILLFLLFPMLLGAQTITDNPGYISINKPGDTLCIDKSSIFAVTCGTSSVFLSVGLPDYLVKNRQTQEHVRVSVELRASEFSGQFASLALLFDFIKKTKFENYVINFNYTGSNMDTAVYVVNSDTVFYEIYTYDGSNNVTQSKVTYP